MSVPVVRNRPVRRPFAARRPGPARHRAPAPEALPSVAMPGETAPAAFAQHLRHFAPRRISCHSCHKPIRRELPDASQRSSVPWAWSKNSGSERAGGNGLLVQRQALKILDLMSGVVGGDPSPARPGGALGPGRCRPRRPGCNASPASKGQLTADSQHRHHAQVGSDGRAGIARFDRAQRSAGDARTLGHLYRAQALSLAQAL